MDKDIQFLKQSLSVKDRGGLQEIARPCIMDSVMAFCLGEKERINAAVSLCTGHFFCWIL